MADLTDLQAAQSVKVVGSDNAGIETFPLAVDSSQQALVKDAGAITALGSIQANQTNGTQISQVRGGTSGTTIGNVGDALKVSIASDIISTTVPTYSSAAVTVIAATNPTDIFIIRGSATRIIKITDIQFSALKQQTGYNIVQMIKRSTDNTGGTFTTLTSVPHESTDQAATAQTRAYTANPTTLGTAVGPMVAFYGFIPNSGGSGGGNIAGIDILKAIGKPIILRGVNEIFALNMGGLPVSGLEYTVYASWIEELP